MSIAALLQAAEYIERREAAEFFERRDREAEHGYAASTRSASVIHNELRSDPRRSKTKKPHNTNRSTHNELEKNRRAHLRGCMDSLKHLVPLGHNSARHTTLGLLIKAKNFIKNLEFQDRRYAIQKDTLKRDARYLRRKLEQLQVSCDAVAAVVGSKRRSVSECSASSTSSSSSRFSTSSTGSSSSLSPLSSGNNSSSLSSSNSESDEIDNMAGYFTHSSEESEDAFSIEGDNVFDWTNNSIIRPKPRVRPSTRISVSSCQLTLSEMDI